MDKVVEEARHQGRYALNKRAPIPVDPNKDIEDEAARGWKLAVQWRRYGARVRAGRVRVYPNRLFGTSAPLPLPAVTN